jgi:hypothetical protein
MTTVGPEGGEGAQLPAPARPTDLPSDVPLPPVSFPTTLISRLFFAVAAAMFSIVVATLTVPATTVTQSELEGALRWAAAAVPLALAGGMALNQWTPPLDFKRRTRRPMAASIVQLVLLVATAFCSLLAFNSVLAYFDPVAAGIFLLVAVGSSSVLAVGFVFGKGGGTSRPSPGDSSVEGDRR